MKSIDRLHALGQSLWYDNIERRLLDDGTLSKLISQGEIRGVTSNPSIFNKAISSSSDYDPALQPMAWAGWQPEQIFFQLAIEDIRRTADLFLPLYHKTNCGDGYVSLEVNPRLAHDTRGTIKQAKELWKWVDRPNLMIKIPATREGIPAVRECIAAGLNINVTLIFSIDRYREVIQAYFDGLEQRLKKGNAIDRIASVASFFVSRVDSKVDPKLALLVENPETRVAARALIGKAAIANAKVAYSLFQEKFAGPRFSILKAEGARLQRPLWASTSTKNPAYRDVLYVEQLIGSDTVNTVPPQTLDAFREHGKVSETLDQGLREAREHLLGLERLGINMERVTAELEEEGVEAFAKAFSELLDTIARRSQAFREELGTLAPAVSKRIEKLVKQKIAKRIWQRDATVWVREGIEAEGVRERLGWLDLPLESEELVDDLSQFHRLCQKAGYTHALLLGMGGSSLAPEVMRDVFHSQTGMKLMILDSTDPAQVKAAERWAPLGRTLYIVASKSGGTAEVDAMFRYFWQRVYKREGKKAGQSFIAITDTGTSLEVLARERKFRRCFLADKSVGGRYSALAHFGLVPAALMGIALNDLIAEAQKIREFCGPSNDGAANPGLSLGAVIGESVVRGRDKITILTDELLTPFGPWLEQLIAESSGKQGRGILPVVQEPEIEPYRYGQDRLFVYLCTDCRLKKRIEALKSAGQPVITLLVPNPASLGGEFYRWEFAIAVACSILGVNAFNQPDVQDNKDRTQLKMQAFLQNSKLEEDKPIWETPQVSLHGKPLRGIEGCTSISEVIALFAKQAGRGDYFALNAYLPRNASNIKLLESIRLKIVSTTGNATTIGIGPRFLHSTGQFHKGGPNTGVFFIITTSPDKDLPIPGRDFSFGTLERAQVLGDYDALVMRKRRLLRIHLNTMKLEELVEAFIQAFTI